ncbi:putative histidine kinase response regulator and transcription factor RR-A-type family [Rosa chinensis]|uniref:histidine kinase n=1 Tax=Rosa chinensis TaxID=74649 RepID=A0A2P6R7I6_ROSCH|nr:putative histidine kinase response regulator and transcription factor RR-A-type family [Rosa chinensis]
MFFSHEALSKSNFSIHSTAKLLSPLNPSTIKLARSLSSSLNGTELDFSTIQTTVAPTLFLALSTIAHISQVTFVGMDDLLFSLHNSEYREWGRFGLGSQTTVVFSNTTSSGNWYTQPVNRDTGMLYGVAVNIDSNSMFTPNASWFQQALNNTSGYSWLGTGCDGAQNSLFFSSVAVDGRGVVSLGMQAQVVVDHFNAVDFHDGYFHLATSDGQVIVQSKLPKTQFQISNNMVTVQAVNLHGVVIGVVDRFLCNQSSSHLLKINGIKYTVYCDTLKIVGIPSVYVLTYPTFNGLLHKVYIYRALLGLLLFIILISLCFFIFWIIRAANREMILCARIIKQEGATRQAERKSMNKTKAFSRANHDVRASLAAITGLIELCHQDAKPESELAINLGQMDTCTKDLIGILNTVLDISKIEAGKVQLEVEEFNLAQLLEDVVDMFYPIAIKKDVDTLLDPCDNSLAKTCHVRGDRGKLKQILCNLISNAVKFTSEGHITVRAMVAKTSYENSIIASNRSRMLKWPWWFYKREEDFNDLNVLHRAEKDPNTTKFVIEVDDTGEGIPKDKREFVFENFVQVTDNATGKEGSGLGLGIVESLVRLMGGEIKIIDKEAGERGSCFRFDVSLQTYKPEIGEMEEEYWPLRPFGIHLLPPSPKLEGSRVVLFIRGNERRKVLVKYIRNLNIKVTTVKHAKQLVPTLGKIKHKLDLSYFSYSETPSEFLEHINTSPSNNSDSRPSDESQSIKEIEEDKKTNSRSLLAGIVLIVVDTNAGAFSELYDCVANFRKGIQSSKCKVVWLDNSITRNTMQLDEHKLAPPNDYIMYKPFHGSRLYKVLGLIPELKGCNLPRLETRKVDTQEAQHDKSVEQVEVVIDKGDVEKSDSSLKLLYGKKVLVVDDNEVLRRITSSNLCKLGAVVEVCQNGKEAFDQVCKALSDHSEEDKTRSIPYDYIFMDCEMPIIDGYEATRLIRKEEKKYDIHLPIIALTAHAMTEKVSKTLEAGMDFHLTKPLQVDSLMKIIQLIDNK